MKKTVVIDPEISDVIMALASVDDNGDEIPGTHPYILYPHATLCISNTSNVYQHNSFMLLL